MSCATAPSGGADQVHEIGTFEIPLQDGSDICYEQALQLALDPVRYVQRLGQVAKDAAAAVGGGMASETPAAAAAEPSAMEGGAADGSAVDEPTPPAAAPPAVAAENDAALSKANDNVKTNSTETDYLNPEKHSPVTKSPDSNSNVTIVGTDDQVKNTDDTRRGWWQKLAD